MPSYASNSLFIVENVKVDVTADNSVDAQEQAYAKAQGRAFRILAKRMVADGQVEAVKTPNFDTVASLVKDYEITNERISAVRYVGTYTFRFREDAVSKLLSLSGVKYTAQISKTLLVLPIFQKDGKNSIWSEENVWMQAWGNARLSSDLVPIEVPIGDLMDIADIDDNNALRYERMKLDRMLGRYDAKEATIMIAVPDMTLLSVRGDSDRALGHLRISIYRTDRARAEYVKDIVVESDGRETRKELYERAVEMSYLALQKDWKSKTVSSAAQSKTYYARVPIRSLKQWVQVKQSLHQIGSLSDVVISSMRKSEVQLSFKFRGDESRLRDAFARTPLSLGKAYQNAAVKGGLQYDLHFGASRKVQMKKPIHKVVPAAGQSQNQNGVHTF
ncbi:MAG: DUF2066 domain-containing protein [Alphaproteobacteria bacterium]